MNQRGFTLVEMLVALTIFALLAAAGVGLLRSSVDTQEAVGSKLADLAATERLRLLLASDLGQAVDRRSRDSGGVERLPFVGDATGLRLVRGGWIAADGKGALQAVRWSVEGNRMLRLGQASVDGDAQEIPAELLDEVTQAAFRFRRPDGKWRNAWIPKPSEPPLPSAVELTVRRGSEAAVRMIVALPPSEAPAPPFAAPASVESSAA
jgi:general secretion pathway protein J